MCFLIGVRTRSVLPYSVPLQCQTDFPALTHSSVKLLFLPLLKDTHTHDEESEIVLAEEIVIFLSAH